MVVFKIFYRNPFIRIYTFLHEASLHWKKLGFRFLGKIQKWSFLTKIDSCLSISGLMYRFFTFSDQKFIFFYHRKKYFRQKNPLFALPNFAYQVNSQFLFWAWKSVEAKCNTKLLTLYGVLGAITEYSTHNWLYQDFIHLWDPDSVHFGTFLHP